MKKDYTLLAEECLSTRSNGGLIKEGTWTAIRHLICVAMRQRSKTLALIKMACLS